MRSRLHGAEMRCYGGKNVSKQTSPAVNTQLGLLTYDLESSGIYTFKVILLLAKPRAEIISTFAGAIANVRASDES